MPNLGVPTKVSVTANARRWLVGVVVLLFIGLLIFVMQYYVAQLGGTWPLTSMSADHPIGNTYGELIEYYVVEDDGEPWGPFWKQHDALDILASPYDPNNASAGNDVKVTRSGHATWVPFNEVSNTNSVSIETPDGTRYDYLHLEFQSLADFVEGHLNGSLILRYTVIGKVRDAYPCNYDHLHYRVESRVPNCSGIGCTVTENPLKYIGPDPDDDAPIIGKVGFMRYGTTPWSEFTTGPNGITVNGLVDIVVEINDVDDAGFNVPGSTNAASSVGIYNLEWRACPVAIPNCSWNGTHRYDGMPPAWSDVTNNVSDERFSFKPDWKTIREEWSDLPPAVTNPIGGCPGKPSTFMILNKGDGAATWDTQTVPNADYLVSIRASDFGTGEDTHQVTVRVRNGTP